MTLSPRNFPWTARRSIDADRTRLMLDLRSACIGSRSAFTMLRRDRRALGDEDLRAIVARLDQLIDQATQASAREGRDDDGSTGD